MQIWMHAWIVSPALYTVTDSGKKNRLLPIPHSLWQTGDNMNVNSIWYESAADFQDRAVSFACQSRPSRSCLIVVLSAGTPGGAAPALQNLMPALHTSTVNLPC